MPISGSRSTNGVSAFMVQAAVWVLALFALVRLPWVQNHFLLPFAGFQGRIACALAGTEPNSVVVGLSCTGADPMALVVGAVMAFPVSWRKRLAGCALGLALILVLNTIRIGSLSLVVDRRELFERLHIYVWPAVLIVAAAGYVFTWMGASLRSSAGGRSPALGPSARATFATRRGRMFLGLMGLLVLVFYLGYSTWMSSATVLAAARWAAAIAGLLMNGVGVAAEVTHNVLRTEHGSYIVTQSCLVTPLAPVYLAATLVLPPTPTRKAIWALSALPLFFFLGIARLLVLALPGGLVGSHFTAIHAFYQVLAAALIVGWLAQRKLPGGSLWARVGASIVPLVGGLGAAVAAGFLGRIWLWPAARRLSETSHLGHAWVDDQGALAFLPPFQIGFWLALWLALVGRSSGARKVPWGVRGLAALLVSQMVLIVGVGELAVHTTWAPPVALIRAVSLLLPPLIFWGFVGPSLSRSLGPKEPAEAGHVGRTPEIAVVE